MIKEDPYYYKMLLIQKKFQEFFFDTLLLLKVVCCKNVKYLLTVRCMLSVGLEKSPSMGTSTLNHLSSEFQ